MSCDLFMFMEWTNASIDPPIPIPPASPAARSPSPAASPGLVWPCVTNLSTASLDNSRIYKAPLREHGCDVDVLRGPGRKMLDRDSPQLSTPQCVLCF